MTFGEAIRSGFHIINKRLQPPAMAEGLDALSYVTLRAPSGFSVTPAGG